MRAKVDNRTDGRVNDPEKTKRNIIEVATREFSEKGLTGARIDEIAGYTRTSKRMIYYYFGGKEDLYAAVLENAYERIRLAESHFDITGREPEEALRALVGEVYDHHVRNEDYVRLVMNENLNRGRFIKRSTVIQSLNTPATDILRILLERGAAAGVFCKGINPVDLHMTIGALSFFMVANKHTFSTVFKIDMTHPEVLAHRRETVTKMVMDFVLATPHTGLEPTSTLAKTESLT